MTYIYAIQHNKTKKIYVGKSKDIYKRYTQHLFALKAGKHRSIEMQNDFDKYGDDFSVYILEEVENGKEWDRGLNRTKGTMAELKWIKKYNTVEKGYNGQDITIKKMIESDLKEIPFKEGLPEVGEP